MLRANPSWPTSVGPPEGLTRREADVLHALARGLPTKTIARGYAKENVLAYIVAPGVVRTRLSEQFAATQGGEQAVTAGLAMGEWVPPEDVAALVAFLATGTCRHLSGATLDVNGATYVR